MKQIIDIKRTKERPRYFLEHCLLDATWSGNAMQALQILSNFPPNYSAARLAVEVPSVFSAFVRLLDFGEQHVAQLARIFAVQGTFDSRALDTVRDEIFMASAAAGITRAKQGLLKMSEDMFVLCANQRLRTDYYSECLLKAFGPLLDGVSAIEAEVEFEYPDCDTDMSTPAPCLEVMEQLMGENAPCIGLLARLCTALDAGGYEKAAEELLILSFDKAAWPSWRCMHIYASRRPDVVLRVHHQAVAGDVDVSTPGAAAHLEVLASFAIDELLRRQSRN